MRKKQLFILRFFIILSCFKGLGAFAITGVAAVSHTAKDHREHFPYICEIDIVQEDGTVNFCSGTLIAADRILTAAHCFGQEYKSLNLSRSHVKCGRNYRDIKLAMLPDVKRWEDKVHLKEGWDLAALQLEKPFVGITPMPVAQRISDYMNFLGPHPGVRCDVLGLGIDASGRSGNFTTWTLSSDENPHSYGGVIEVKPKGVRGLLTTVEGGDSGGAMICSKGEESPQLVGVTRGTWGEKPALIANTFTAAWGKALSRLEKENTP